jgi:hypothetical protein
VEPTFHLFHIRKRSSASKIKAALVSWGQKLGIFQREHVPGAAWRTISTRNAEAIRESVRRWRESKISSK